MSAETDEALAAINYRDHNYVLNDIATRENVEANTKHSLALARYYTSKAKLRDCLRRWTYPLFMVGIAWSIWFWSH